METVKQNSKIPKLFLNKSFREFRINLDEEFQAKWSGTILYIFKRVLLKPSARHFALNWFKAVVRKVLSNSQTSEFKLELVTVATMFASVRYYLIFDRKKHK